MTKEERAAARARCEAAEPDPWEYYEEDDQFITAGPRWGSGCLVEHERENSSPDNWRLMKADAVFVAHARADLPAALDQIDRLERELKCLRATLELAR